MCYNSQTNVRLSSHVPFLMTWFIRQTIVDCLSLSVFACVLNQSIGHRSLLDALNFAITMSFKARDEMHLRPYFQSLMDDDIGLFLELTTLASNIKLKVFGVLDSFLSFLKTYEEKKTHNMLSLMLDLRLKSLHFVSSYVDKEQRAFIVE